MLIQHKNLEKTNKKQVLKTNLKDKYQILKIKIMLKNVKEWQEEEMLK